jgi:hypothetical protein
MQKAPRNHQTGSTFKALILIDSSKLRTKEEKLYMARQRELSREIQKIKRFEEIDETTRKKRRPKRRNSGNQIDFDF